MMLTAALETSSVAPRQNRLKKPRPLRSLSIQEGSVDQDGAPESVVRDRKLSLGSLEVDVSAAYAGIQGLPVCKEIAALSSRLLSSTVDQQDFSTPEHTSLSLHTSSSTHSSYEHPCASGHQELILPSPPPPPPTAATSAPADRHRHFSVSAELPVLLENHFRDINLLSKNISGNSNCESFHMALDAYGSQPKYEVGDEGYGTISINSSAADRGRFQFGTPNAAAAGTRSSSSKDQDTNQSFQCEPSLGATQAVLMTNSGDELMVTGSNFKTVLHASRILLKELDAKLVRIESVHDDDGACRDEKLVNAPGESSEVVGPKMTSDPCITGGCFPQHKRWNRNWHYSKDELLQLSQSMLSHQPPSMWHVIANTHSDCCIPATKVRKYFEPSAFHSGPHGSLVVDKYKSCL